METAVLGGGCFWCLEAVFEQVRGVELVVSGYCGGHTCDPHYKDVCQGSTGHAEVVQIRFDSERIGFRDLLEIFFAIHDPTTPDRQGNDVGTQYRSVIFYQSEDQRQEATRFLAELDAEHAWNAPIVTELLPAQQFYPAEDYHWKYFRNNPTQAYCAWVIGPKVSKFRRKFAHWLKQERL